MKGYLGKRLGVWAAGLLLALAPSVWADTVYVGWDSDRGFSPNTVTINVGDTVAWIDNDPDFPTQVTSDNTFGQPNYFQFILANQDDVSEVSFDTIGTIGYSDNYGHSGSITINEVVAVTITLSSPRLSGGAFVFDADGLTVGKTNVLEVSANLINWTAVATNAAASSTVMFTNSVMPGSQFFRVAQLP